MGNLCIGQRVEAPGHMPPPRDFQYWKLTKKDTIGEQTILMRLGESRPVKFYANWRCPYSQRVWIGLEEKSVDYDWVEIEAYDHQAEGPNVQGSMRRPLDELARLYPAFVKCSPHGEIPALDNCDEYVEHSLIMLEYIQEAFRGPPLLPTLPKLRAHVRAWTWHVNLHIVPHFDRLLSVQDADGRFQARQALVQGLAEYEAAMAPEADGPFFLGDDFSMADIALAPFWWRMCSVLRAYRRFDAQAFPRLQVWFEAVEARPSFLRTAVDLERLIEEFPGTVDTTADEAPGPLRKPVTTFRRGPGDGRMADGKKVRRSIGLSSVGSYSSVSSN